MSAPTIDLGHDHQLQFYAWKPDDLPENRERYGALLPNIARAGAFVHHLKPDGSPCVGSVQFDLPEVARFLTGGRWTVQSWEPLTISPSLLCACGDHGFIREGKWVPA